jgi:hypothetical protein
MESRAFGEKDPVSALQKAAVELLATEVRRWRTKQLEYRREKLPLDSRFADTLGMLARSVATLTAELRKGGKDMRDAGSKLTADQRDKAVVEYLRDLPPARRAGVLSNVGAGATDG